MISCAQDVIVPLAEGGFLLVEELEFGDEETVEVLVHEKWRWLVGRGEPSPVKVGSECVVAVGIAKVRGDGVWVGARRDQACWDSANVNGARLFPAFCSGTHWEDGFPLRGVMIMREGVWNCQWRAKVGSVESWLFGWLNVEEILHCVGDHGNGEGWVRLNERLEVFSDHVGRKGVEKDVASFGTGDGLFP